MGRQRSEPWRHLLAIGACAGDWSAAAISRYGGVSLLEAEQALDTGRAQGVIGIDSSIDELERVQLLAELSIEHQSSIHAAVAYWAFSMGPDHHRTALEHARAAGTELAGDELIELLDRAGELSLSLGAYGDARDLLVLADELDSGGEPAVMARRLCTLATAIDGLGLVDEARHHLARAVSLADLAGDAGLMARAAVQYALPADWYAGDARAAGFLRRAEQLALDESDRTAVLAARSLVEMRIPLVDADGQQFAWVTRPSVAQPLADEALTRSASHDGEVRMLALIAWRGTHRAPEHLEHRLAVSAEALDLAQHLGNRPFLVDAGVWMAVDHLEAGNRTEYLRAVEVVRWAAEHDGNPRLRWRALTLAAGRAYLEGDHELAERHLAEAQHTGRASHLSGLRGARLFFTGQAVITIDDPASMAPFMLDTRAPVMQNPIGRAYVGYMAARTGDHALAERLVHEALEQLDAESSYLFLASRAAAAAVLLDRPELWHRIIAVLQPWSGRMVTDSNGWWCDGPVDAWLAMAYRRTGDLDTAAEHAVRAQEAAVAHRDVRTQRRLEPLLTEFRTLGRSADPGRTLPV